MFRDRHMWHAEVQVCIAPMNRVLSLGIPETVGMR